MIEKEIKRNQPAAKLLRQFCDKASGKVSTSRKELQHRFDGLDWAIQKKFLGSKYQVRSVRPRMGSEETIQDVGQVFYPHRTGVLGTIP